jgi:hypothetical protein
MENLPNRLRADLRPDEHVVTFAWARIPRPRTGYQTDASTAAIINAVDLVRGWRATRSLRRRSAAINFPLDRHMAMAVTEDRLVIWRASRRAIRAPVHLGDVPLGRIRSARLPYVGGGWKVVEVRLVDGRGIRFLADQHHAERLAQALS